MFFPVHSMTIYINYILSYFIFVNALWRVIEQLQQSIADKGSLRNV